MAWAKAGSTTLTTAGTTVTTPTMTPSKFNVILGHTYGTGNVNTRLRVGVDSIDTGSYYSNRYADNGGSDDTSETTANVIRVSARDFDELNVVYGCNIAGEEKLFIGHTVNLEATALSTAPTRTEFVAKWVTTAGQYKLIQWLNSSADFPIGSNISVLGSDLTPSATVPAIPALISGLESPSVGGWVEVGRTTLGSGNTNINVASIPDKRYYMILRNTLDRSTSGGTNGGYLFNNDSGSNYSFRRSGNGGSDGIDVNFADMDLWDAGGAQMFAVEYIANLASKEKLFYANLIDSNTAGAGNVPHRAEIAGKWANTSAALNRIDLGTLNSNTWNSGSEVVVLGWDEDDTHTTNFWEELYSSESTGDFDTGTITAKKYLWVQVMVEAGGDHKLNFNGDTGSNYSKRVSHNGGSDGTAINNASNTINGGQTISSNEFVFYNLFIVNNASNEKLVTGQAVITEVAGSGTAPERLEIASKWDNTSEQISRIQLFGGSTMDNHWGRVWGSN